MIKFINIGNEKSAIKTLKQLKDNDYVPFDVKITNSHIMNLNQITQQNIFRKDVLYINSKTVWEIMQPQGGKGNHNYHGLTEKDVLLALSSFKDPYAVFVSKDLRFSIVSVKSSHFGLPLMTVIETDASLIVDAKAKINKVVTIYPKDNINDYLNKIDQKLLIYKK